LQRAVQEAGASEVLAVPEPVSAVFLAALVVPRTGTSRDNFKAVAAVVVPVLALSKLALVPVVAVVARSRSAPSVP
jgi:hypothetical protein